MPRHTSLVPAVTCVVLITGCQWKGGPGATTRPAEESLWRPAPLTMRVYPSSRFVQEGEQALLEARIELLDAMNDSVKAGGDFRFELFPESVASARTSTADRLYSWDVSMRTLDDQRRYYDPITRAYLFRLKLDDLAAVEHGARLVVTFTAPPAIRLEADTTLSPSQP